MADFLVEIQSFEPLEKEMIVLLEEAMSASYSASLFVTQKPHRIACWMRSPLGEVMTRPMLDPLTVRFCALGLDTFDVFTTF